MGKDTAFAGMKFLIPGVMGVGRRVDKSIIKVGFTHIGTEAVDLLESSGRVKR